MPEIQMSNRGQQHVSNHASNRDDEGIWLAVSRQLYRRISESLVHSSEASRFVVMFLCGPPKRRPMVQCQRNSILDRLHGSVILDNVQKDENGQKKRNRSPMSQRPSEQ